MSDTVTDSIFMTKMQDGFERAHLQPGWTYVSTRMVHLEQRYPNTDGHWSPHSLRWLRLLDHWEELPTQRGQSVFAITAMLAYLRLVVAYQHDGLAKLLELQPFIEGQSL